MKSITSKLGILFVLPLLLAGFQAEAKKDARHGEKGMARIIKQLDLTDEQKLELKKIKQQDKAESKALAEKLKASRKATKEALNENSSEETLRAKHKEHQKLRNQMDDLRFEKMMSIQKILTPEQKKKFHELMKEKKGRKGKKRAEFRDEE